MSRELKQETLAEIEEELRSGEYAPLADRIHAAWEREKSQSWHHREMEELILRHEKEVAELKKLIPQPDPDWKAICEKCKEGEIEPDCEYYGEPNGCNSPIYGEHPKSQPIGNAAAMREALGDVYNILEKIQWYTPHLSDVSLMREFRSRVCRAKKVIDIALSAPARNCDVEYADRVEMYGAFKDWCKAKGHTMEPMLAYDAFDWLLAPAAQEGAGK